MRSSGYGSKETDSVSFKSDTADIEEEDGSLNLESPGTVAEIRRSFENLSALGKTQTSTKTAPRPSSHHKSAPAVEIVARNPAYVKSIEIGSSNKSPAPLEVILEVSHESEGSESPSPKKTFRPRVSHLSQALQRQEADRVHERDRLKQLVVEHGNRNLGLRFNPLVNVVAQDQRYVTAISVSPTGKPEHRTNGSHGDPFVTGLVETHSALSQPSNSHTYFNNEYPLLSLQPDSLITEDTLQMMNYPNYGSYSRKSEDLNVPGDVDPRDMPNFGRAMYSSFYSSIKSGSSASQDSLNSRRERNSLNHHPSAKKKGVNAVKDLWEKTGLKTNGRKLLVDVSDLINEERPSNAHTRNLSFSGSMKEDYRSMPVSSTPNGTNSRTKKDVVRTISGRSSDTNENLSSLSHFYDDSEGYRGIDNLGFLDDRENFRGSTTSSLHSRTSSNALGHQFQHNLTNFQRRVSERIQGEPNHRKSWLDVEKGLEPSDKQDVKHSSSRSSLHKDRDSKNPSSKRRKNHPGKAVRELGLEDFRRPDYKGYAGSEYTSRPGGSFWTLVSSVLQSAYIRYLNLFTFACC